ALAGVVVAESGVVAAGAGVVAGVVVALVELVDDDELVCCEVWLQPAASTPRARANNGRRLSMGSSSWVTRAADATQVFTVQGLPQPSPASSRGPRQPRTRTT